MKSSTFAMAYALDWIAGDPHSFPHPVRLIGSSISAGERRLRREAKSSEELLRGAILSGAVIAASWFVSRMAIQATGRIGEVALAWTTLAMRSLIDAANGVIDALERDDIAAARTRLAMIVGRDTDSLDEAEIARAVIETVAESLCDGVVAPMFYLALGGVPLAMAYKAVNTLDSMIGHREFPYLYFGRVAARLDDIANFLPARLTAAAIAGAAALTRNDARESWTVFRRDGSKHPSPNAGQSEAAMAGALGVRLGGMNYYDGKPSAKPALGAKGRTANRDDARASIRIAAVASAVVFAAGFLWLRSREKK